VGVDEVWQQPQLVIIQAGKPAFRVGILVVLVDAIRNQASVAEPM